MMHCLKLGLITFSVVLAANLSGCTPGSPREASETMVHWDRMGTMVIAMREFDGVSRYLLEGKAALKVAEALRKNTVAESYPSRTTQMTGGTYVLVCAFEQDGGPLHRFLVDFQSYEGMPTKSNPTPTQREDQCNQSTRCRFVLTLVEEKGLLLSRVQFKQYSQQFDCIGYIFLYWKN